ncbi:MAG: hypothetical protein R3A79_23045 [Nannocystaceae bacterium]
MRGLFTGILYFGAALLLAGFILPMLGTEPRFLDSVPSAAPEYLGYSGVALMIVGLAGRSATRPLLDDRAD